MRRPMVDPQRLKVQLAMAKQQHWDMSSVGEVAEKLRSLDPAVRSTLCPRKTAPLSMFKNLQN